MTVTFDVDELTSTLSAMLSAQGFGAAPLEVAGGTLVDSSPIERGAAEGGLADAVLLNTVLLEGELAVALVALRDDTGAEPEALCASVAEMVAGADRTSAEREPVSGAQALLDSLPAPLSQAVGLTDGDTMIGLVLIAADRRGDDAEAAPAPNEEAFSPGPVQGVAATPNRAPMPIGADPGGLDLLRRVALEVSVELGRTRMTLDEVMGLDIGSVIELDRSVGAPVDVRVNDTLIARGEVVVVDGEYAVRLTEIVDRTAG